VASMWGAGQVDLVPRQRAEPFGAGSGEWRQQDVGAHAFEGRPICPVEVSQSSTTARLTLSRA
jgi:hypothetical protein